MEIKELKIEIKMCSYDELDAERRLLVDKAKEMTRRSYAPYSKFHVGAAIELADGTIVGGANQENAAFSSGTCAERSACFYASSRHPGVAMKRIAIAAWTRLHRPEDAADSDCFQSLPISPCGSCRQSLLEYETLYGPMEVILYGAEKIYILPSVASLLPLCFMEF